MLDLRKTIIAKSDQLNADDLMGGPITIQITKVELKDGEQPVSIHYEGDQGKPYKPGKSMRRVLIILWGPDGNAWIGRWLTLYRDEKVSFGGMAVGGLRISHMSHIDKPVILALTASKANKKPFEVLPLVMQVELAAKDIDELRLGGKTQAKKGLESLKTWWEKLGAYKQKVVGGAVFLDELKAISAAADEAVPFDASVPAAVLSPSQAATISKTETVAENATVDEIPLIDRVNTMCMEIDIDREQQGTNDFKNVIESEEFKLLWAEVRKSGDKVLLGKISEAMQGAK